MDQWVRELVGIGYVRELARLIATYLPTVAESIRQCFFGYRLPALSVERASCNNDEGITREAWLNDLHTVWSRAERSFAFEESDASSDSSDSSLTEFSRRLVSFLQEYPRAVHLPTIVQVGYTQLRIWLNNDDVLVVVHFNLLLDRCTALSRFNHRLWLFFSDLKLCSSTDTIEKVEKACRWLSRLAIPSCTNNQQPAKQPYDLYGWRFLMCQNSISSRNIREFFIEWYQIPVNRVWNYMDDTDQGGRLPLWREIGNILAKTSNTNKLAIWNALDDLVHLATLVHATQS
jgi:hypothetical protein